MKRIVLIGYMGSGKTTVGKALAKEIGLPFYDLDWYIESRMRKKVSQIFAERGEEGFRQIERNMLHEVAEFEDVVVSCGGGTHYDRTGGRRVIGVLVTVPVYLYVVPYYPRQLLRLAGDERTDTS